MLFQTILESHSQRKKVVVSIVIYSAVTVAPVRVFNTMSCMIIGILTASTESLKYCFDKFYNIICGVGICNTDRRMVCDILAAATNNYKLLGM